MKASEFIEVIETAIEKYGDLHIMTENESSGDMEIPCTLKPSMNESDEECAVIDQALSFERQLALTGKETSDFCNGVIKRENISRGMYFKI